MPRRTRKAPSSWTKIADKYDPDEWAEIQERIERDETRRAKRRAEKYFENLQADTSNKHED